MEIRRNLRIFIKEAIVVVFVVEDEEEEVYIVCNLL
jgi:hypothetical protein